ncbi:unnamed protein product [Adineta ricciae]|uniref:Hexosyltransferase n=1 Tax=Adineta ricciae TaxID=249248 RepID=A0A816FFC9_ADIRI|nr:unnamed protein product [Adineta ricciae]
MTGTYMGLSPSMRIPTIQDLNETNFVILNKINVCENLPNTTHPLLIAIKSAPDHRLQRNVLRLTWLKELTQHHIPYIFILGATTDENLLRDIALEDLEYQDLVMGKPIDNYHNLTLKVIFLFAWTKTYCPSRWLLYTDDDTIVNVQSMFQFLDSVRNESKSAIYCHLMQGNPVLRDPNSKWFVPESLWKSNVYPNHCSGGGYLLSPNVLHLLHEASISNSTHPKIWVDDAFITGIVPRSVGVEVVQSAFMCCGNGILNRFNQSIALLDMGREDQFVLNWKKIKGNSSLSAAKKSKKLTPIDRISRFDRSGHILTKDNKTNEVLLKSPTEICNIWPAYRFLHLNIVIGVL